MPKTFPNVQAFHAHYAGRSYFGSINADGTVTDHETLEGYKAAHPEDFTPLEKLIPVSAADFGQPNHNGDVVIAEGRTVAIEETAGGSDLVLCTDGYGNEWWEKG